MLERMPKFINNFSRPLIVLLVISLVCTGVMTFKHYSTPQNRYKIIEACDLLTPEIAKKVGGQDMPPAPQIKATATDSTVTTFCVYRAGNKSVSVVVRSPRNQKGVDFNTEAFQNPGEGVAVPGYGDKAFWSPTFAQFNVLKNGRWYIFSNGVNIPSQRSANDAQKLAAQVDF